MRCPSPESQYSNCSRYSGICSGEILSRAASRCFCLSHLRYSGTSLELSPIISSNELVTPDMAETTTALWQS